MNTHKDPRLESQLDTESQQFLKGVGEEHEVGKNRLSKIKTVLVVLSSRGLAYDTESLSQKIKAAYPGAEVFFIATEGKPCGASAPASVDLVIDFTGPGSRQGIFAAKKFRKHARIAIGRNAGFFRKKLYDRIFDEKKLAAQLPEELLAREQVVQKAVLKLAGVSVSPMGDIGADLGKSIALDLPPMHSLAKK